MGGRKRGLPYFFSQKIPGGKFRHKVADITSPYMKPTIERNVEMKPSNIIRRLQKNEQRKKLDAQADAWRKYVNATNSHYSKRCKEEGKTLGRDF